MLRREVRRRRAPESAGHGELCGGRRIGAWSLAGKLRREDRLVERCRQVVAGAAGKVVGGMRTVPDEPAEQGRSEGVTRADRVSQHHFMRRPVHRQVRTGPGACPGRAVGQYHHLGA